jgi:hypothetical protein
MNTFAIFYVKNKTKKLITLLNIRSIASQFWQNLYKLATVSTGVQINNISERNVKVRKCVYPKHGTNSST